MSSLPQPAAAIFVIACYGWERLRAKFISVIELTWHYFLVFCLLCKQSTMKWLFKFFKVKYEVDSLFRSVIASRCLYLSLGVRHSPAKMVVIT